MQHFYFKLTNSTTNAHQILHYIYLLYIHFQPHITRHNYKCGYHSTLTLCKQSSIYHMGFHYLIPAFVYCVIYRLISVSNTKIIFSPKQSHLYIFSKLIKNPTVAIQRQFFYLSRILILDTVKSFVFLQSMQNKRTEKVKKHEQPSE